jgi:hypothetical protein
MAENNMPHVLVDNAASAVAATRLHLMPFWTDAPHGWFQMAEAQFHLHIVTADYDKYCLLVASLNREAFKMVGHLLPRDDRQVPEDAYVQLKRSLVSSHILSNIKKVELLSRVEPQGGRRPSELLAAMLELCPHGHETSPFFAYLFLQRLPQEICMLLADEEYTDMRALAAKADRFMVLYSPQAPESSLAAMTLNADSSEEETVAAATTGRGKKWKKNKAKKGKQEKKESNYCHFHSKYGEKARKGVEPCSWPEN